MLAGQRAKEFELEEATRGAVDKQSDFALKSAINEESVEDSLHAVEAINTSPPEPVYQPESSDFGDSHARRLVEDEESATAMNSLEEEKLSPPREPHISPFSKSSMHSIMEEADFDTQAPGVSSLVQVAS